MGLLNFFLSVASLLGNLSGWLEKQARQDRERMATYFDQIAACLREVAERIETGDPPRDTCRRLAVYASDLEQILDVRRSTHVDPYSGDVIPALVMGLRYTMNTWSEALSPREGQSQQIMAEITDAANGNLSLLSSEANVESLAGELEEVFASQINYQQKTQVIWDAAGEFSALADGLRAR